MAYRREDKFDPGVTQGIASHVRDILLLLGEDPDREGLAKTPERVARSLQFLTKGYSEDGSGILRQALFEEKYGEMVLVRDIDLFSLCEHHVLPFLGKCHVAYIPDGTIVGLSKIARVVEVYARRLQVQERLTREICECIQKTLSPVGVAVAVEANHTCMIMRGVEKPGTLTLTCAWSGSFEKDKSLRQDFLRAIGR